MEAVSPEAGWICSESVGGFDETESGLAAAAAVVVVVVVVGLLSRF
jgi:hypothetical protein